METLLCAHRRLVEQELLDAGAAAIFESVAQVRERAR